MVRHFGGEPSIAPMKALAENISERLLQKKFCTVFEPEISRVCPLKGKEVQRRNEAIKAFAQEHGWSATIWDPGVRVVFRNLDG
jgi:hypothetical protein